jgi:phosphoribosylanthranilate isomerase
MLKICGLQSVEVLKSIIHLPIDAIGFVLAPSRRRVTPESVGAMLKWLHEERDEASRPLTVGVFVNPTLDELTATLTAAPLDVVQLHGSESAAFCKEVKDSFPVKVWKVVSVKSQIAEDGALSDLEIENQLGAYRGIVDAILLDTFDPDYGGGSGKTFSWHHIPAYRNWAHDAGLLLFVAGGLNPDNVEGLISTYHPDGVDVSSGVETDGGKDIYKITAFAERVSQSGNTTYSS